MEFIDFLETEKINYLFRISSNDYKFERKNMESTDESVILRHTHQRLEKVRKRHPDRFGHMKEKGGTYTRIVTSLVPSGKELALMTNLPFEITQKEQCNRKIDHLCRSGFSCPGASIQHDTGYTKRSRQ